MVTTLCLCLSLLLAFNSVSSSPNLVTPTIVSTTTSVLRTSGNSTLYQLILPSNLPHGYVHPPLVVDLRGTRRRIGYDYAALLHTETVQVFTNFMNFAVPDSAEQYLLNQFLDYCWHSFLIKYTPKEYLEELEGMDDYYKSHNISTDTLTAKKVSHRYYTIANMPAGTDNIISMLEYELEGNWPDWLKNIINTIIKIIERIILGCDAYGVWGSRTSDKLLFTSRNLDWTSNTGIDQFKLISIFTIQDGPGIPTTGQRNSKSRIPSTGLGNSNIPYATIGFATGLGALAGMNTEGMSMSQMNLQNSRASFSGIPFPLRIRSVLEKSYNLESAVKVWKEMNNTSSFNFLVGSATDATRIKNKNNNINNNKHNKINDNINDFGDSAAIAIETTMDISAIYGANSTQEKAATYNCEPGQCTWTNQTGTIHIGNPLPEAVWRSNHAFDSTIMVTQDPLFNDTIFRYNFLHDIISELNDTKIDDTIAVSIAATLGTKGNNYYSCENSNFDKNGKNVMSITYAPGKRDATSTKGRFYVAWEQNSRDNADGWRPAACNPYIMFNFDDWIN